MKFAATSQVIHTTLGPTGAVTALRSPPSIDATSFNNIFLAQSVGKASVLICPVLCRAKQTETLNGAFGHHLWQAARDLTLTPSGCALVYFVREEGRSAADGCPTFVCYIHSLTVPVEIKFKDLAGEKASHSKQKAVNECKKSMFLSLSPIKAMEGH